MTLQDIVTSFKTTPFLFAGSGITRRYYNLPGWEELLRHFSERISSDPYIYQSYKNKARGMDCPQGLLPKVASLIQKDFDEKWYSTPDIRSTDEDVLASVKQDVSPFKAEVADYLKQKQVIRPEYTDEIRKLKNIAKKNIAGIITTNYDSFFENLFEDYKVFVGQDELVFSSIMGIAEVYKIHGSVSRPDSIVINEQDYHVFNEKGKYLAAKLMTIFMEYPILFIGYSLTDINIQNILRDIMVCLPDDKIDRLQERFIFVDYRADADKYEIFEHSMSIGSRMLKMTGIALSDFGILYEALAAKSAGCPIKILRRFKDEIYTYAVTNRSSALLRVAKLDDPSISEESLAISIGVAQPDKKGLYSLVSASVWYRGIVLGDIEACGYTVDDVIKYRYSELRRDYHPLPVYRYLSEAEDEYPEILDNAEKSFNKIASNTCIKERKKTAQYPDMRSLWEEKKNNPKRVYNLLCCLPEEKMDVGLLEEILTEFFRNDPNALDTCKMATDVRRLIRMYDFLKWGKKRLSS